MRPANVVTAISDILAGIAISGFFLQRPEDHSPVLWLILATMGLYAGGVVMNDVFDCNLDAVERPERPIPSGLIRVAEAGSFGIILLVLGVLCALLVSRLSGSLALATALAALVYDKWAKHNSFLGPLNMGMCRGLNLLLGISIVSSQVTAYWYLAFVPIIYIAAITMISRGEVHGGDKMTVYAAAVFYGVAMATILYISLERDQALPTFLFVLVWAFMVFFPLKDAARKPEGRLIGRAVKAGVLALILMNAAWAAAFGATYLALIIVLLLPLSILLARAFSVT